MTKELQSANIKFTVGKLTAYVELDYIKKTDELCIITKKGKDEFNPVIMSVSGENTGDLRDYAELMRQISQWFYEGGEL